jgi:transposase InsO family protein
MRAVGLCGRRPRRWKRTTIPDPAAAARADLIRRDFAVDAAAVNTRWCGDITYIWTWEGWLYLATVIDIASRRVVGFALAEHLRTELVADALTNAVAARDPAPGVVFHADRGCQYTSGAYATLADDLAVILSSGRTGQCWDNALAESFFASLKGECLDQQPWPTRAAAHRATVEYIAWYNGTRLHSALGYRTRRVRDRQPPGGPHPGSLTEPPTLSVKTGQPHQSASWTRPSVGSVQVSRSLSFSIPVRNRSASFLRVKLLALSRPEGSVYRAKYLTLPFRCRRLTWAISRPFSKSGLGAGRPPPRGRRG